MGEEKKRVGRLNCWPGVVKGNGLWSCARPAGGAVPTLCYTYPYPILTGSKVSLSTLTYSCAPF